MDDDAATQRLLDELTRLDALAGSSESPVDSLVDGPALPLSDLSPAHDALRSPTAQFFTFFAADADAATDSGVDGLSDELLRFLDASLGDENAEESSTSPPATTTSTTTSLVSTKRKKTARRTAGYDSNRARNERRHELAYLRRKVTDMETELALLRNQEATNLVSKRPVDSTRAVGAGVWEQIATRQHDERQRAERENVRLRAALETQLRVAKGLECFLQKPALTKSLDAVGLGSLVASRVTVPETLVAESDKLLLQKLVDHVEQIYAQVDVLVSDNGVGVRSASRGSLAEIFVTDRMPFTLDAASKAAWTYFSYKKNYLPIPSRLYYERHDVENMSIDDTVVESSGMERMANGVTVIVKVKQVLRRYVERDRVVIAWSAVSQPVELNGQPFSTYDLREWGCMVLTNEASDTPSPFTVLRSCYFITPEFTDGEAVDFEKAGPHDIGRITDCVLGFTTARMATWRQRIENILLDDQRAASR